jgi:hypothetical protein
MLQSFHLEGNATYISSQNSNHADLKVNAYYYSTSGKCFMKLLLRQQQAKISFRTHYFQRRHKQLFYVYKMIQEERSVFWEVMVRVIVRKNVHMNMCLILNVYRDRDVRTYKYYSIVNGKNERGITCC